MNVEREPPERSAASGRDGPNVTLILFAVVVALAITFFLQNDARVTLEFLFFEFTTTVRLAIVIALVIGILLDRLFGLWWRHRRR
jgi:uncharacterized integral membrane protein